MIPAAPSFADASSSAVTVGPRQSGLTIGGERALPSFLVGRLQAEPVASVGGAVQPLPIMSPWLAVGGLCVAALVIYLVRS